MTDNTLHQKSNIDVLKLTEILLKKGLIKEFVDSDGLVKYRPVHYHEYKWDKEKKKYVEKSKKLIKSNEYEGFTIWEIIEAERRIKT